MRKERLTGKGYGIKFCDDDGVGFIDVIYGFVFFKICFSKGVVSFSFLEVLVG